MIGQEEQDLLELLQCLKVATRSPDHPIKYGSSYSIEKTADLDGFIVSKVTLKAVKFLWSLLKYCSK